jgi:Zn-dependent protease/predicted transcriptional regulator
MAWRWRLGEVFGIVIYMHVTFLLLIAWAVYASLRQGGGWGGALAGIALILLVFTCVVAHEYGHALTARRYGIQTRDITLLPIGGVARLERMPRDPMQELLVALAGPAVNVVIAAFLYLVITVSHGAGTIAEPLFHSELIHTLLNVNLWMIGFNLLPAFPMDGGRVLRALLARRMEYSRATRAAASVGQMMAFLFGFVGLMYGQTMLLFIALFVYMGAEAEAQAVQMQTAFSGHTARQAMLTRFVTLQAEDSLSRAVQALLSGSQQDFPVALEDGAIGLLTRRDLLSALHELGPTAVVRAAARLDIAPVDARAPLDEVFQRLQTDELSAAPVMEMGRLAGLITLENIAEFLMVQAAMEGSGPSAGRGVEQEAAEREWTGEAGRPAGAWRQRGSL